MTPRVADPKNAGETPRARIRGVRVSGKRYAFVGDLVWRLEGITLREEKPWFNGDEIQSGHCW